MLTDILNGELPSAVFKKLIENNPELTTHDISVLFRNEFGKLDSQAGDIIWHWRRPGRSQGISDSELDSVLIKFFQEASYLPTTGGV